MLIGSAMAAQADSTEWGFVPVLASLLFFVTLLISMLATIRLMRRLT